MSNQNPYILSHLDDYQDIFGSLNYLECEPCQSIFSRAAYFVNLMWIVEEHISKPNNSSIPEGFKLNERRPDLQDILLNCDNTNNPIFYTQIVNKVLEKKLKENILKEEIENINEELTSLDISLEKYDKNTYPAANIPRYIGLKIEKRKKLLDVKGKLAKTPRKIDIFTHLATAKYPQNLPFNFHLEQIRLYLGHLNTSLADIYQTLHPQGPYSIVWAREYLGLSLEEYDLITNTKDLQQRYGFDSSSTNYLQELKKKETFLKRTGLSCQELNDLLYQNLSKDEIDKSVAAEFYINKSQPKNPLKLDNITIENLDDNSLYRIDRFLRLSRKLGWSFADLDWVLTSIEAKDIDEEAIKKIAKIKLLQETTKLSLDMLCTFWYNMKWFDEMSDKEKNPNRTHDLFNVVFNNQFVIPGTENYYLLAEGLISSDNKATIKTINDKKEGENKEDKLVAQRLASALQLSQTDFEAIIHYIFGNTEVKITLQNLSTLFRTSQIIKLLKLSLDEYKLLLEILSISKEKENPLSIDKILQLQQATQWLKDSGLKVSELNDNIVLKNICKFIADLETKLLQTQTQLINAFAERIKNENLEHKINEEIPKWVYSLLKTNKHIKERKVKDHETVQIILKKELKENVLQSLIEQTKDDKIDLLIKLLNSAKATTKKTQPINSPKKSIPINSAPVNQRPKGAHVDLEEIKKNNLIKLLDKFKGNFQAKPDEIEKVNCIIKEIKSEKKNELIATFEDIVKFCNYNNILANNNNISHLCKCINDFLKPQEAIISNILESFEKTCNFDLHYLRSIYRETYIETFGENPNFLIILLLARKLNLSELEIKSISSHPHAYNISDLTQLTFDKVRALHTFKQLQKAFKDDRNLLAEYFNSISNNPDEKARKLADITGWSEQQISELMKLLNLPEACDSVSGLVKLKRCFDLCEAIGANINSISLFLSLSSEPSNSETYQKSTHAALALLKAKHNNKEWAKVFEKLNSTLEERKCRVLTNFALWKLEKENLRQLSEYLLLDVEMTSCACNSEIQLAILSVQTYLQRCRIGIEPGVTKVDIPTVWWDWIMNYRKWEANRKVFLYPENYIDPSLRKNTSPIFKELQDELMQSEITAETVEAAYRNYFDKFAELARLQIVDSCRYLVQTPKSPEPIDTLFIFAKTITQPHTFYYRRCEQPEVEKPFWVYWEKIDLQINSEYLAPVYAFNRLFLFWVETKEIKKSEKDLITQATIKYSFLNASQKWAAPQTFPADIDPSQKEVSTNRVLWQRVYPSVLPASNSEPEKILISVGRLPALLLGTIAGDFLQSYIIPLPNKEKNSETLLSQERTNLVATTIGNLVVFAGGYNGSSWCDTVDVFEYKDGNLVPAEYQLKLSKGRTNLAATTIGNIAVFAGGYAKENANELRFDTVDVFEYKNGELKPKEKPPKLSEARENLAATTIENLVVFAGGYNGSSWCDTVDVFEYKNEELKPKEKSPKLSKGRTNLAATTIENLVVFAGGYNGSSWCDTVDVFEYKDGNLVPAEYQLKLSIGRANLVAATIGNLVVFAGGYAKENVNESRCDTVDVFEYKNGELKPKEKPPKLSEAREKLAATTIGNLVVFAGGYNGSSWCDTVDVFEYKDGNLVPIEKQLKLSKGRYELAATTIGNLVVFAGGYAEEKKGHSYYDKTMDVFSIPSHPFSTLPSESNQLPSDTTVTPIKNAPQDILLKRRNGAVLVLSQKKKKCNLTRLTTNAIQQFSHTLFAKGLDGLLSLESQQISEPEFPLVSKNNLDFDGAYGAYFWEIFFHIPFLIASTLNAHQRYNEARQWYQYIFNPTIPSDKNNKEPNQSDKNNKERFWRFLPFQGQNPKGLEGILNNTGAIQAYNETPFDPHAIARLRIGAYEKAVVMKYIDNLLNWGDTLFTQDSWESITQATTLYLLAYDLLGPKPKNVGKPPTPKPKTFAEIKAGAKGSISDFLIDLETHPEYQEFIKQFGTAVPFNALDAYFCVSENQEFAQYWDRIEDRLFKIRHCQNIKGIERQLALFQPPLDPMQLVRQAAAGDGAIALSIADTVPHYRFSHLLERAKGMASTVIQLGSTLLNTLEKKDAEELSLLRATQEPVLLQLITKTKEKQIEEAQANLESLEKSLQAAKEREQYYQHLIAGRPNIGELTAGELTTNVAGLLSGKLVNGVLNAMELATLSNLGLNAREAATINLMQAALNPQIAATALRGSAAAAYLLPNIFGTANGGMQFGDAVNMGAVTLDGIAGIFNQSASLASTVAQFQRRKEDWEFQQKMAEWDVKQIKEQIKAAKVREHMAKAELDVHHKSIEQSREVEQFFKDKFTNKELYQWMVGRLSSLYFQTYKIALEMAYSAQKAYQYELNKDDSYLQPTYWDSNKKGLLAGESLMLGLNQLEKAYLDGSDRRLEIEKIISLRQLEPDEKILRDLKNTGSCTFSFDEKLFALDFPSHYCRQIKTISVSIPAVVGPYQNIKATLTQTSNIVLIKPDADAVKWLLTRQGNDPPNSGTLRQDWRNNQQIAISKGVNDNGLFVLNFQDDRYLPFEGTGAISHWALEMPKATNQIDFDSITDVIITLNYTALEGGSTISKAVAEKFKEFTGQLVLNLKRELLQNQNCSELSFVVSPNLFRKKLKSYSISASPTNGVSIYLQLRLSDNTNLPAPLPTLQLKIANNDPITLELNQGENGIFSAKPQSNNKIENIFAQSWSLSVPNQKGFFDPQKVIDIALVVAYEGKIEWPTIRS